MCEIDNFKIFRVGRHFLNKFESKLLKGLDFGVTSFCVCEMLRLLSEMF